MVHVEILVEGDVDNQVVACHVGQVLDNQLVVSSLDARLAGVQVFSGHYYLAPDHDHMDSSAAGGYQVRPALRMQDRDTTELQEQWQCAHLPAVPAAHL